MSNMKNLLDNIRMYQFCAVELNLFLDNYPDDKNATDDYCRVSEKLSELTREYEKNYGPLSNFGTAYIENPKKYIETPWPWENIE